MTKKYFKVWLAASTDSPFGAKRLRCTQSGLGTPYFRRM